MGSKPSKGTKRDGRLKENKSSDSGKTGKQIRK